MFLQHILPIQPTPSKLMRNLFDVPTGKEIKIVSMDQLSNSQRLHLQAYGLLPGRSIRVLAQSPVTIIQIEETELAFEHEIARKIEISA